MMRWNVCERLRPSAPITMRTASAARSSFGAQRAQIVGDALGQHRHHAVGEIDRIAAHERLAVERRAGRDVMSDVGDGDGDDEAACVAGAVVRRGMHRVVMILGVGRIDGDERQAAPILAAGELRRLCAVRLTQRVGAEHLRDRMGVDRDQADRALALERAEPLDDARGRQPKPRGAADFDGDQVAVFGVSSLRPPGWRAACRASSCRPARAGRRHARACGRCRARALSDDR